MKELTNLIDTIELSYDPDWSADEIEKAERGDIWFDSQLDAYRSGLYDGEKCLADTLIEEARLLKTKLDELVLELEAKEHLQYSIPQVLQMLFEIVDIAHDKGIPTDEVLHDKCRELQDEYKKK